MKPIWRQVLVNGSDVERVAGVVATITNNQHHTAASFSGNTTVILGAATPSMRDQIDGTTARWHVSLDAKFLSGWQRGYVVMGCIRNWGGCHSATKGQLVEIFLNGQPIDWFRLRNVPPPHDDYFHRPPPVPDVPSLHEIASCQTVYLWPILKERVSSVSSQTLEVRIEHLVNWDIDYVGILAEVEPQFDFDIALSFAGEDRDYVRRVADFLRQSGVKVFYDEYARADLFGEDLYVHLADVYCERARYTVMFISIHYKKKLWTNHERQAAQARAFREATGYILPARFDDTEIPGLLPTRGYVDLRNMVPEDLGNLILKKLAYPTNDA